MCGEKIRAVSATTASVGSPPRVRGKGIQVRMHGIAHGITPACAGKRTKQVVSGQTSGDHPRVCGEKYFVTLPGFSVAGSPPRVRGKAYEDSGFTPAERITPACAGKSREHPHKTRQDVGSPPRVRGKVFNTRPKKCDRRITPACAGKSVTYVCRDRRGWDHPRVCGEKSIFRRQRAQHLGSPPRVRGKGLDNVLFWTRMRITPACAGKSRAWPGTTPCRRDHPRVCGEKPRVAGNHPLPSGSPPRVRGKVG